MQEFNVPQFIDIEDRIVGPITTRQFLTMLGGAGIIVVFYKLVPFNFFLVLAVLTGFLTVLFSFIKVRNQPFHLFLVNLAQSLARPPIRVWGKDLEEITLPSGKEKHVMELPPRRILPTPSKISELALMVDTGGVYRGEEEEN